MSIAGNREHPLHRPHALFSDVVSSDDLERLAKRPRKVRDFIQHPLGAIRDRHIVLGADESRYADTRRAWGRYFDAARRVGLLEAPGVLQELKGDDDDAFRGALAECIAAWFFRDRLGARVTPRVAGRDGRPVDFRVAHDGVHIAVEVKAPAVEHYGGAKWGDDREALTKAVAKAGRQLDDTMPGVVVLVPALYISVRERPEQLMALLGTNVFHVDVSEPNVEKDRAPVPAFRQDGKLSRLRRAGADEFTTDLTRVSAVAALEERVIATASGSELAVDATIVHNPFAKHPVSPRLFGDARQLVCDGDEMTWVP